MNGNRERRNVEMLQWKCGAHETGNEMKNGERRREKSVWKTEMELKRRKDI